MQTSPQLEILNQARKELYIELVLKDKSDYTNWLAESEAAWATKGEILPFNSRSVYPSEDDLASRIAILTKKREEAEAATKPSADEASQNKSELGVSI